MNFENPSSTRSALRHLHAEIRQLIQHIRIQGSARVDPFAMTDKASSLNKSTVNLAHYLALRELDLQPLQEKLSEAGLSSLDGIEPHVFASLKNVLHILSRALGISTNIDSDNRFPGFREGAEILETNTQRVLGDSHHQRITRIMVTMPAEAASDYALVRNLIEEGMDIARINCAHDDVPVWRQMIANIRQAAADSHAPCRILMDLAGHKIRTGPIPGDTQSLNIKIKKNSRGTSPHTIQFRIIPDGQGNTVPSGNLKNEFVFPVPHAIYANLTCDDRFSIVDTRGKQRYITIAAPEDQRITGYCDKTIHLATGLQVTWQRRINTVFKDQHTFKFVNLNPATRTIRLYAGDNLYLHKQQIPGFIENDASDDKFSTDAHISCSSPDTVDLLELGARVWIDDGKISAYVTDKKSDHVVLRISRTELLQVHTQGDQG